MNEYDRIQELIQGYKRFRSMYFESKNTLYRTLSTEGQTPKILIIACCDSRVDPALLLDCSPGDLFVIRNVANLVPPCEYDQGYHGVSAALEFAVCGLNITHIIVLGHTQCGGIRALFEKESYNTNQFISKWMKIAHKAYKSTKALFQDVQNKSISEQQINVCAQKSIIQSLENLTTFPWISKRLSQQNLFLHGWFFDISKGILHAYQTTDKAFQPL